METKLIGHIKIYFLELGGVRITDGIDNIVLTKGEMDGLMEEFIKFADR